MEAQAIVAATDGSEESLRAVDWAAAEALLRGKPLRIVSAMSLLPWTVPLQLRPDRDYIADLIRSEREQALVTAASRAAMRAPGLVIDAGPLGGPPAQAIVEAGSGALMLVVGSRGVGAFTAMTLGSVSRYVSAHAGCPVVVVRDPSAVPPGQVVVGVGDPDDCAEALTLGFEEAELHPGQPAGRSRLAGARTGGGRGRGSAGRSAGGLAGQVPRRPSRRGGRARPSRPDTGGPVGPRRPRGDRPQACPSPRRSGTPRRSWIPSTQLGSHARVARRAWPGRSAAPAGS